MSKGIFLCLYLVFLIRDLNRFNKRYKVCISYLSIYFTELCNICLIDDWLKFFMDAGIPQKDALGYAVKFAHNRIQINMLPELNKEYLKEMDITILGDVISILRHAKIVHEKVRSVYL